jgi:hypothetical protein
VGRPGGKSIRLLDRVRFAKRNISAHREFGERYLSYVDRPVPVDYLCDFGLQ